MFAQYSPLFTSGLLETSSPATSYSKFNLRLRKKSTVRESVPVSVNSPSASFYGGAYTPHDASDDSAIFLTFMPRRHHIDEDRSFLSLDLAESQSMRSMSLRRKDTVNSRATISFGTFEPTSSASYVVFLSPTSDFPPYKPSSVSVKPSRRSTPRDANRLPRAKPMPSSSLPELPKPSVRSRKPSNLKLTLSTWSSDTTSSSSPFSPSVHRYSHSAPSLLSPALRSSPLLSPGEQSYFTFSSRSSTAPILSSPFMNSPTPSTVCPPKSPVSPTAVPAAPTATLKVSASMRSTASHHTRQLNRSAALAALEGRSGSASPRRDKVRPRNFMSMSDDEDEPEVDGRLMEVLREEEGVVVPTPVPAAKQTSCATRSLGRSSGSSRRRSSRRGTIESFLFPLTNFIDFKDDDRSTRSWRSFVEISS
ncbi:hypothetical protein B0H21DRAFT_700248 [Amylocystis lapponica]|nr:hypothetical protein B0H21DRAFT_700248 [Amylocystis lapponica]